MTTPRPVRYRCQIPAQLIIEERHVPSTVLELSERGAFIDGAGLDVEVGTPAVLRLPLPGGEGWETGIVITRFGTTRAELAHPRVQHLTVARQGVGVEFATVADGDLERLRDFLELLDER